MEPLKTQSFPKVLTLIQAMTGRLSQEELERREADDLWPRVSLFEKTLPSDMLTERFLDHVPAFRRKIYATMPVHIAQVLEAYCIRDRYDAIISWAENMGLPFAALMKLTGVRKPHVGIFSWISKSKKGRILERVHTHFDRIVLMSSSQQEYALRSLHVPERKIALLRWPVDIQYWRPLHSITPDLVSSVGREMRDYETLITAVKNTDIRCHIAAGGVTLRDKKDEWKKYIGTSNILSPNITVGKKTYPELRELYARSKFVVIPILPTDTDNGTTSILEAMAMGKAVICSKTEGQRDVIQDGKTGIFVPLKNPRSMREAIDYLSANPEVACRMGREGRKFVETHHSLENFILGIRNIVDEVVHQRRTP